MNARFAAIVETMAPKRERLLAMTPLTCGALPRDMPKSGRRDTTTSTLIKTQAQWRAGDGHNNFPPRTTQAGGRRAAAGGAHARAARRGAVGGEKVSNAHRRESGRDAGSAGGA
jgi:hypothetical protein